MRAADMLVLTNMLAKIISEVDDLKEMIKEAVVKDFRSNFEEEE
jgi:hypothetical protein